MCISHVDDSFLQLSLVNDNSADDGPIQPKPTTTATTTPQTTDTSSPQPTPPPPPKPKLSVGAIVGAAIGGQVLLVAIILFCWHQQRRRSDSRKKFEYIRPHSVPEYFSRRSSALAAATPPSFIDITSQHGGVEPEIQSTGQAGTAPPAYNTIMDSDNISDTVALLPPSKYAMSRGR